MKKNGFSLNLVVLSEVEYWPLVARGNYPLRILPVFRALSRSG
jgi:hypothetical protein